MKAALSTFLLLFTMLSSLYADSAKELTGKWAEDPSCYLTEAKTRGSV